jgi:hypothetical protein
MSEWITDRLPTKSDLVGVEREVWYYCSDQGFAFRCHWSDIKKLGEPWQPIKKPAPYVKPKRWSLHSLDNAWILRDTDNCCSLPSCSREAAQRIEDLFNEVMP